MNTNKEFYKQYLGATLYNNLIVCAGKVVDIQLYNGKLCFVCDGSIGKFWGVDRLNNPVGTIYLTWK